MNNLFRYKSCITLPVVVIWLLSCTGQNDRRPGADSETGTPLQNASGQAIIAFDTLSHDFGTIIEGEKIVYYFGYTNSGTGDLVVYSVEASCGCTTPDWNREPLVPGGRDRLKVIFDTSGRTGIQQKAVTVGSNAGNSPVRLAISAKIKNRE